jgi:tetratricopeptide (TPR) repeat protein
MAVPDLQDALDCLQQKKVDDAITTLERKLDELPAHLTAHVLLARAYETKREWEQALTCWENVYFLMPNSPVAREGKRRVLRRLNRGDEAKDIEEAAPSPPAHAEPSSEADDAAPGPSAGEPAPDETASDKSESGDPTTAAEAVSELEKLRRQAEDEARRGGARSELADSSDAADEAPAPKTPADRVEQMGDADDDLDRLIDELESARIEPTPDVEDVPAPDLDNDVDDLVSETLARIHEAQDQYRKAAQIYVKLASQEPGQAREYLEKAAEMRREAEQNAPDEDA